MRKRKKLIDVPSENYISSIISDHLQVVLRNKSMITCSILRYFKASICWKSKINTNKKSINDYKNFVNKTATDFINSSIITVTNN